ncbi:thiamine phosphate synthase [Neoehrlichia mikurensis]|uniref:Thiamine-phosphate synthase n=1 Tax=Neoehrlichia mikurensis TaxID=89586 RepID=A0A9Q9BTX5_9RICK|nr:thiamine phosphate synthase [Neoehrlichia mikurensis]QXK92130.1 thiamine phosphate synthase [Neoehrlichia mikurensis]QXK92587.1 thiamine phosphate synthase [Neoehrlichia mikurensis]QXK93824.1 thiamine phosphate synthase [Neoehrlichia mikurensis]UTO55181.1 thiamine phosphate synthase [Neoehrlichia mikurensis]UTO56101.1 thiamine phosphate synthase [Neoehrlichia mikurensis]
MYIIEKKELNVEKIIDDVIYDLYIESDQDVFIIDTDNRDTCIDYYFDGEEKLQFIYSCNNNSKEKFHLAYKKAIKFLNNTKCLNIKDAYYDCLVLARAYVSLDFKSGLDDLTSYYFPCIVNSFQQDDVKFNFKKIKSIGLYYIVPNIDWLKYVVDLGANIIQLRIKDKSYDEIEKEIAQCIEFARKKKIKLFINDYWQFAIKYGADGVHLGQEDLKIANVYDIYQSGLYLGISTHCYHELARACYFNPSYIAFGPIFPTTSKTMKFNAQGLKLLTQWVKHTDCSVVAIGGINLLNVDSVVNCGVSGVAVISAIIDSSDPKDAIYEFQKRFTCL